MVNSLSIYKTVTSILCMEKLSKASILTQRLPILNYKL